ncbi:hypothetical protein ACFQ7A_24215 [Streptomyces sp. NPDC056528]|uniref:hypothetical protein n=1 Tax=Streptomyces sp. NPDC056528 TaxID=3345854 RepID=UPI00367FC9AA
MNQAAFEKDAKPPRRRELPGALPRLALALVPPLSLGVLGFVPSLVLALRRGARADWLAALLFTALSVGWWFQIALTPEETHGLAYLLDLLLLTGSTVAAAAHCLLAGRRPTPETDVPVTGVPGAAAPATTVPATAAPESAA